MDLITSELPQSFMAMDLLVSVPSQTLILHAKLPRAAERELQPQRIYVRRFGKADYRHVRPFQESLSYEHPVLTADGLELCFIEDGLRSTATRTSVAAPRLGVLTLLENAAAHFIAIDKIPVPEGYSRIIVVQPCAGAAPPGNVTAKIGLQKILVGANASSATVDYHAGHIDLCTGQLTLLERLPNTFY